MELFSASDAPSVDRGVLARLHRLDRKLLLTFSHFAIDPTTSRPVEVHPSPDWEDDPEARAHLVRRGNAFFLLDPCYHLWTETPDGRPMLVQSYPISKGGFGHLQVAALEADVARRMKPSEIAALWWKNQNDAKEREAKKLAQDRDDLIRANESRIHDLVFEGKRGVRDAKIASYPGQGKRSTPGEIMMDDKEAGWEKPDHE